MYSQSDSPSMAWFIPHSGDGAGTLADDVIDLLTNAVVRLQGVDPAGQRIEKFFGRKFIEHRAQHALDVLLTKPGAVDRQAADAIFFFQLGPELLRFWAVRVHAVQRHHKRFVHLLKLGNHPLLRLDILRTRNFGDAAVGGDHNANGGMVGNYFSGANLRCPGKRDFMVKPGSFYHPFRIIFNVSGSSVYHKSYAVNEPYLGLDPVSKLDFCRLLGNKFRLCSSNGFPARALGQFILCPYFFMLLGHIGKYH